MSDAPNIAPHATAFNPSFQNVQNFRISENRSSQLWQYAMAHGIDDAIARLRQGDDLRVKSIRDVGPNLADALVRIEEVHAKGGAVVDAKGRRTSNGHEVVTMLREALPKMRKGLTKRQAAINGRRGRKRKERMPVEEAAKFWFDKAIMTNARALQFMTGWSVQMAHRQWPGGSGRPTNKGPRKRRKR